MLADALGAIGAAKEAAVVAIVSVAVAVVVPGLSATVDGLKMQLDCAGRPEHADAGRLIVALNPFTPVNASVVTAEAPGVVATMLAGLAETVKLGPAATVSVKLPLDAP